MSSLKENDIAPEEVEVSVEILEKCCYRQWVKAVNIADFLVGFVKCR